MSHALPVMQENHTGLSYENHEIMSQAPTIYPGNECEGAFDFKTNRKGDLNFKKGEVIKVLQVTRDPQWFKGQNARGEQGMVPANYITKRQATNVNSHHAVPHKEVVKLYAMPWFHGKITRSDADALLRPPQDGLFLVRESTNFPGDYTLCVSYDGDVEHYRIIYKNNKLTVDEEDYFENLTHLVQNYTEDADGLVCQLTTPLRKKGGLEVSVNTEDFKKAGWAVNANDVELGAVLGDGAFGDVLEGTFRGERVAVKSTKDKSKAAQAFLAEAAIMTMLCHKNLVQLRGVVIPEALSNDPIYIILEFMSKGAMLEYLRSRGRSLVTSSDLLKFARDIASGMSHVESKNLVHRDLAARNILISHDCVAKVSDFGLARDASFSMQGVKFPVKWTAPEALKEHKFSNKSDVWSYGITLWEMWAFGRAPYPRVPLKDLRAKVESGYRMSSPERCEDVIYQLMRKCWLKNPEERPSFAQIVEEVDQIKLS